MKSNQNNWGVFGLEFIGSLIYLGIVFTIAGAYMNGAWSSANLWLPLLYATAVVSSVALFFISFANLMGMKKEASRGAMCATVAGGFALFALTYNPASWGYFIAALIGYIIAFIGAGLSYK